MKHFSGPPIFLNAWNQGLYFNNARVLKTAMPDV